MPPSPNKFAAKPLRALPRQHPSWLARAGSSRSLSSQNILSALNPVLQVPEVHKRSKVPSGLNPQTSKSSLGSQSGPPNVPSVLNPVLKMFPQLSILLSSSLGPQTFSKSSLGSQSGSPSSLKVHSFTLILNPVLPVQKRFSECSRSSQPCSHIRSPCSHFVPKSVSLSAAGEHEALDQMAPRDRVGSGCSVLVG